MYRTIRVSSAVAFVTVMLLPTLASSEPMTLSMTQVLDASTALVALDSYESVVKEAGTEKVVKIPYQLSGAARIAIARNLTKLKGAIAELQAARAGKIAELTAESGQSAIAPGSSAEKKLGEELTKMLAVKQEFDLVRLSAEDLGLLPPKNNPVPPSVLAALGELFDSGSGVAAK